MARQGAHWTIAAIATYFAVSRLGLEELSWALISAVYVMQRSVDDTGRTAFIRAFATILGSGAGMASLWLLPASTPLRLALVTVTLGALIAIWPRLLFAIVPALLLAAPAVPDPLSAVWSQGAAILLGSGIGVASSLVWPQSSKRRAQRALARAVDECCDLIDSETSFLVKGNGKRRFSEINDRFWGYLTEARNAAHQIVLGRRLRSGPTVESVVVCVEKLWYSLILLDRLNGAHETPCSANHPDLVPSIERVRDDLTPVLEDISEALRRRKVRVSVDRLRESLADADSAARAAAHLHSGVDAAHPHASVIAFALNELNASVGEIVNLVGRDERGTKAEPG